MLASILRKSILTLGGLAPVRLLFEKYGMRVGVNRFVAAETLPDALQKVRGLQDQGLCATLDFLGENALDLQQAKDTASHIVDFFPAIDRLGLRSHVSVKLTQLGLRLDAGACHELMERIVGEAAAYNSFVRIDMEDSSVTQSTIDIFRMLLLRFGPERIGLAIQAYLFRSEADAAEFGSSGINLRIVKGAYREPPEIAYPHKKDVDAAYLRIVRSHLEKDGFAAIATHDPAIIHQVIDWTQQKGIPRNRFEFQMLYGIASELQLELAGGGYPVRVYTPFGRHWYPYFTRRIAERPANLWFVAKHLLRP